MSQTVFGAQATVTFLNRAFNNTTPGNLLFQNQVAAAGTTRESQEAFARTFGNSFASLSNEALAERVLTNMGVLPSTNETVVAFQAELAAYLSGVVNADRGLVVLQLSEILATLDTATGDLAPYAAAAVAWNNEVTKSFEYSVNPANTATTDPLADTTAPVVTAATFTYAENQAADHVVGTVAATDAVGVTAFEITTGNDAGYFAIDATGKVTLTAAGAAAATASNDFETTPNAFTLGVVAKDAAGNTSTTTNVTINVTDVDDRAPVLTGAIINGTKAVLSYDETLATTKVPAVTDFAVGIKGAAGAISVTGVKLVGTTVELTLGRAPAPGEVFTVTYTAGTNPVEDAQGNDVAAITARDLTVDVTAPVITAGQTISYAEDIVTGVAATRTTSTVLGKVVATDDAGVVSYNITAGNANGFFAIDGSGNITLTTAGLAGSANDFEVTPNSTVLTITATDGAGNVSVAQQVTLTETNVTSDDAAPQPTPAVITLTTAADNATPTSVVAATKTTAGNDTIAAFFDGAAIGSTGSTISLADAIDAGAGTGDKLTLTLANGATAFDAVTGPVLNGVETLELRPTGATANVVTLTGIAPNATSLVFDAPSGAGATVGGVANAVNTFGLTNANVTTNVALKVNSATGLTGSSDAVTINVGANAGLAADRTTGVALSIQSSAARATGSGYELVTLNSNGGASAFKTLVVSDSAGLTTSTMTTLTVSGSSNLTIGDALEFNGASATKGTVSANNFTGNLDLSFDGAVIATANTITGGSGNDRFNFVTAAKFDASDVINGGTGTDTLALADLTITAAGAATLVAAINATTSIERLEQTGAVVAGLEASALTQIHDFVFSNKVAAATVTGVETADSFTFTGATPAASSFAAKTDGAADVLNLTYSRADGVVASADVTASNFETLNLTVTSANGTIVLDGTAGVGGAKVLNIAAGGTINVLGTGAAELALGTGANINASTASGLLSLTGSALANTITGGTNNDTILAGAGNDTVNSGNGNDTISGEAGADQLAGGAGNDTFIFRTFAETQSGFAVTDTTAANIDRITDFVGNGALAGDVINIETAILTATTGAAVTVTPFTVASANNFNDLAGALGAIQASGATLLNVADVTVSSGSLAGRYAIINDNVVGYVATTDIIIGLTGVTGALHASDFAVVAALA